EQTVETFADGKSVVKRTGTHSAAGTQDIAVTDNDSATVSIVAGTTGVTEGGVSQNVQATLTLTSDGTGIASDARLAVDVSANLPGNADYSSTGVTFNSGAAGGATANIVVSAVNDRLVEQTVETF